ncbi:MAG TPA: outer membrane lipoprotein chaperone LolA, partial [Agitococcus sp.]|nr:outer membrane lipoprotein chaperone LolA [Agitococcus sp.]
REINMRFVGIVTLSLVCSVSIADEAASKKLNALLEKTNSMQASFEQRTLDPKGQALQTLTGTMWVQRPYLFRWDTKKPFVQQIIANSDVVWVYDPDLQQATKQKLDKQVGNTPALLLSGDSKKIASSFNVSEDPKNSAKNASFILKPKDKEAVFETLRVSFTGSSLKSMHLKDSLGQKTDIFFSQMQVNGKIAPSLFQFTPPKDVDVIDE